MAAEVVRIARPRAWREDFIRAHGYRCHYCNRFAASVDCGPDGKPWHLDHKKALANGGEDIEDNLVLACSRCNIVKHTLPYRNFRDFARSVLWADEPQRITDQEIDDLVGTFLDTSDGTWSFRVAAERSKISLWAHDPEELGDSGDNHIAEFSDSSRRRPSDVEFVILAHRLVPKLVAEIHLLRAEVTAAQGREHPSPAPSR